MEWLTHLRTLDRRWICIGLNTFICHGGGVVDSETASLIRVSERRGTTPVSGKVHE